MEKLKATDAGNQSLASTITRRQCLTEDTLRRVAAMLGLSDGEMAFDGVAPFGWHFALIGAETNRDCLRADGFPGLGISFPRLPGKRLVAASRTVEAHGCIRVGQAIERISQMKSITPKATAQGNTTFVVICHVLRDQDTKAHLIVEEQTYMLFDSPYTPAPAGGQQSGPSGPAIKSVTPDETLLFQFSALSLNSHKIHLDRDYARDVEGYPDLVVNGGLTTLFMTEIARATHGGNIARLKIRNSAPLFCNRAISFTRHDSDGLRLISAYDDCGRKAAEMEYELNDI
jgi:3-methylfumaryl-CoA hydratase